MTRHQPYTIMIMDVRNVCHYVTSLLCLLLSAELALGEFCEDSKIEICHSAGVRIESYNRSRVELYPLMYGLADSDEQVIFQLQFEFKTRSADGFLFFSRSFQQQDHQLALVLRGGQPLYMTRCPGAHADIVLQTGNDGPVNDNEWHNVSVIVKDGFRSNDIKVDNFSYYYSRRHVIDCSAMWTAVMGGISDTDQGHTHDIEDIPDHFEGCIRNVRLFTDVPTPAKYYFVSNCS